MKNDMDKNKVITFKYGYKATVAFLIIFGILLFGSAVVSIIFSLWGLIAVLIVLAIILIVCLINDGALYPIYIDNRHVGFRGKKLLWKDIKITLCRAPSSKRYDLIIGTAFLRDKNYIKRQKKQCPCISLNNAEILKTVLQYYKAKLLVVNTDGIEQMPELTGLNKDINAVIIEHNSLYNK